MMLGVFPDVTFGMEVVQVVLHTLFSSGNCGNYRIHGNILELLSEFRVYTGYQVRCPQPHLQDRLNRGIGPPHRRTW